MSKRAVEFYQKLNFLRERIEIAGDEPSLTAASFLDALAGRGSDANLSDPFKNAVAVIHKEFDSAVASPGDSRKTAFESLEKLLNKGNYQGSESKSQLAETLWAAFFPEALYLSADSDSQIHLLREKRVVRIDKAASQPVIDPAREILFTSNVLLSPPVAEKTNGVSGSTELDRVIADAAQAGREKQLYWYDHPIPVGTPLENDEAVYGLSGLARALSFEMERGSTEAGARLKVLLSVSVTHKGLHQVALPWLRAQIGRTDAETLENLDVYAFTENDTEKVVELLSPWLNNSEDAESLKRTFGVDGEYGRHYSFLKALPALWSVLTDPDLKATFKIDLDQVFPQKELVAETGKTAFDHFKTDLWGARGRDSENREVELGMIAGALVNEKDIASGLFTPDIPWPEELPYGENLLFYKLMPMAVSTRAELMTRYSAPQVPDSLDGVTKALHRIHVTGGTNGIRFDALRHHRPFTPSFIGRAEDQGYLLSVLAGKPGEPVLRYAHASGLVMRHDKEAFAGDAVKAGKAGSYVGDLIRLFVFSCYADFLPGGRDGVKKEVDPFTGCFISPLPVTLALLRLALHLLDSGNSREERQAILELAGERLPVWIHKGEEKAAELKNLWHSERKAWDSYYNALDRLENALSAKDAGALNTAERFNDILENCRIT
ncbi:MAG: hypothetical protein DRZ90_13085 [Spirochaetes bacterium]|nr:MAG: hypothetical protein DRZ90_13085 [Spirochaetota bacterium]